MKKILNGSFTGSTDDLLLLYEDLSFVPFNILREEVVSYLLSQAYFEQRCFVDSCYSSSVENEDRKICRTCDSARGERRGERRCHVPRTA